MAVSDIKVVEYQGVKRLRTPRHAAGDAAARGRGRRGTRPGTHAAARGWGRTS